MVICFWYFHQGPSKGRNFPNSTMVGIGLTMEGIFQNEVIYEFMNENSYSPNPRNLTKWLVWVLSLRLYCTGLVSFARHQCSKSESKNSAWQITSVIYLYMQLQWVLDITRGAHRFWKRNHGFNRFFNKNCGEKQVFTVFRNISNKVGKQQILFIGNPTCCISKRSEFNAQSFDNSTIIIKE